MLALLHCIGHRSGYLCSCAQKRAPHLLWGVFTPCPQELSRTYSSGMVMLAAGSAQCKFWAYSLAAPAMLGEITPSRLVLSLRSATEFQDPESLFVL